MENVKKTYQGANDVKASTPAELDHGAGEALRELNREVEETHESIGALERKLQPVLIAESPIPKSADARVEPSSRLTITLLDMASRLRGANYALGQLYNRLDVPQE